MAQVSEPGSRSALASESESEPGSGPALASEVQWAPEKSVAAAGEICVGTERTVAVGAEGAASARIVPAFGSDYSTMPPDGPTVSANRLRLLTCAITVDARRSAVVGKTSQDIVSLR